MALPWLIRIQSQKWTCRMTLNRQKVEPQMTWPWPQVEQIAQLLLLMQ
jgi:hypothetical protein